MERLLEAIDSALHSDPILTAELRVPQQDGSVLAMLEAGTVIDIARVRWQPGQAHGERAGIVAGQAARLSTARQVSAESTQLNLLARQSKCNHAHCHNWVSGECMNHDDKIAKSITTLSSREVYRNKWMRVREDEILRSNGEKGIYGVVEKHDGCVVLPIEDGRIWLVEQYRYTIEQRALELPQGGWEMEIDDPEELARGELKEELGLGAAQDGQPGIHVDRLRIPAPEDPHLCGHRTYRAAARARRRGARPRRPQRSHCRVRADVARRHHPRRHHTLSVGHVSALAIERKCFLSGTLRQHPRQQIDDYQNMTHAWPVILPESRFSYVLGILQACARSSSLHFALPNLQNG